MPTCSVRQLTESPLVKKLTTCKNKYYVSYKQWMNESISLAITKMLLIIDYKSISNRRQ